MYLNKLRRALREMLSKIELTYDDFHDYQRVSEQFLIDNPYCGLYIDMGMGKTGIALKVACDLLASFEVEKVLIVAPLRVANRTWPDEIEKWEFSAPFKYQVLTCPEVDRPYACQSSAPIHIINRENIPWLVDFWRKKWPYDMVIIDESTSFKDHTTKRFKKMQMVRPLMKRLVLMTASPAAESYVYFFAQIGLLDYFETFGKFITKFKKKYFDFNRYTYELTLREGADKQIEEAIAPLCLVMKAEDYLDMPPLHNRAEYCTLPPKVMEMYNTLQRDFIVTIGDQEIEAEQAASLSAKLRQLASGFLYTTQLDYDPKTDTFKKQRGCVKVHDERQQELLRILEECHNENVLIAYHFKESLEDIKAALPKCVVMDKEGKCVTKWNQGKIKHLVAHPQSAGHGLNLQKGGRRIVFYDMPESLEYYEQFVRRLFRQGQQHACFVHHLIMKGTRDEIVYRALQDKANVQSRFFVALKEMQRKQMAELRKKAKQTEDEEFL